jgi:hypothetical protein
MIVPRACQDARPPRQRGGKAPDRIQPLSIAREACRPGVGGPTRAVADRRRAQAWCRSHTTWYGLKELPECRHHVLEVLRQPFEDGLTRI